jgi:hypothetical protein
MPLILLIGNRRSSSSSRPPKGLVHTSMHFSPDIQVISLDFIVATYKDHMRILVAVAPKMYRETLAHILRTDRPDDDVRLSDPQALDREAASFRPHLVVCNDNAEEVPEEVSVPSWVVIRFHDHLSASVFIDGQDPRLIQDIAIKDLIWVVEETQRLVA